MLRTPRFIRTSVPYSLAQCDRHHVEGELRLLRCRAEARKEMHVCRLSFKPAYLHKQAKGPGASLLLLVSPANSRPRLPSESDKTRLAGWFRMRTTHRAQPCNSR